MEEEADALQARARSRVGQVLREKWRLDKLLGVGGMAAVYAATHINNGRRAAIKLLHVELSANVEVRTRFLREGYVANKVQHPGTVAVLDDQAGEDGTVFLVMELLEGETLEDRRERLGSLPAHEVLSLTDRLLDVLAAAHEKDIVHRDIKPENVFLTREGAVKVLDFGIARMRELSAARLTLTTSGAIGTPAFMPPEQARGRWDDVGPKTDLWALGATMFTLVSGRLVHEAETVNELMLAAMTKQAPPVASVVPSLSPPVAAVIDRALAYDVAARWPDARTMQAALRSAYQSMGQPAGALPASPPPNAPASPGATGQPVTLVGAAGAVGAAPATPPARGFPVPVLVGGLGGALVMGAIVLLVATRHRSHGAGTGHDGADPQTPPPAVSTSAVVATAVAETVPSAAPTTQPAPAAPSASALPAGDPSSAPTAGPSSTADAKPHVPVPVPVRRPGSAWPGHKR